MPQKIKPSKQRHIKSKLGAIIAVRRAFVNIENLLKTSARLPLTHLGCMAALQNLTIVSLLPAFCALSCNQSASADISRRDFEQVLKMDWGLLIGVFYACDELLQVVAQLRFAASH